MCARRKKMGVTYEAGIPNDIPNISIVAGQSKMNNKKAATISKNNA